jgi:hypothetical protein
MPEPATAQRRKRQLTMQWPANGEEKKIGNIIMSAIVKAKAGIGGVK